MEGWVIHRDVFFNHIVRLLLHIDSKELQSIRRRRLRLLCHAVKDVVDVRFPVERFVDPIHLFPWDSAFQVLSVAPREASYKQYIAYKRFITNILSKPLGTHAISGDRRSGRTRMILSLTILLLRCGYEVTIHFTAVRPMNLAKTILEERNLDIRTLCPAPILKCNPTSHNGGCFELFDLSGIPVEAPPPNTNAIYTIDTGTEFDANATYEI
jgi:hypothetical protein